MFLSNWTLAVLLSCTAVLCYLKSTCPQYTCMFCSTALGHHFFHTVTFCILLVALLLELPFTAHSGKHYCSALFGLYFYCIKPRVPRFEDILKLHLVIPSPWVPPGRIMDCCSALHDAHYTPVLVSQTRVRRLADDPSAVSLLLPLLIPAVLDSCVLLLLRDWGEVDICAPLSTYDAWNWQHWLHQHTFAAQSWKKMIFVEVLLSVCNGNMQCLFYVFGVQAWSKSISDAIMQW